MSGKNPWISAILSLVIGGLGHLYIGRLKRALFFFALEVTTAAYALTLESTMSEAFALLNIIVSVWAAKDAYHITKNQPVIRKTIEKELYI